MSTSLGGMPLNHMRNGMTYLPSLQHSRQLRRHLQQHRLRHTEFRRLQPGTLQGFMCSGITTDFPRPASEDFGRAAIHATYISWYQQCLLAKCNCAVAEDLEAKSVKSSPTLTQISSQWYSLRQDGKALRSLAVKKSRLEEADKFSARFMSNRSYERSSFYGGSCVRSSIYCKLEDNHCTRPIQAV